MAVKYHGLQKKASRFKHERGDNEKTANFKQITRQWQLNSWGSVERESTTYCPHMGSIEEYLKAGEPSKQLQVRSWFIERAPT